MSMTPEEITQWVDDTRRRSFKNGWDAAVERAVDWFEENLRELVKDQEMLGIICPYMDKKVNIEKFRQFMEE